jgi:hypothetical protein
MVALNFISVLGDLATLYGSTCLGCLLAFLLGTSFPSTDKFGSSSPHLRYMNV